MTFNTTGDLFDSLNSHNAHFIVPDYTSFYDVFIIFNVNYVI